MHTGSDDLAWELNAFHIAFCQMFKSQIVTQSLHVSTCSLH